MSDQPEHTTDQLPHQAFGLGHLDEPLTEDQAKLIDPDGQVVDIYLPRPVAVMLADGRKVRFEPGVHSAPRFLTQPMHPYLVISGARLASDALVARIVAAEERITKARGELAEAEAELGEAKIAVQQAIEQEAAERNAAEQATALKASGQAEVEAREARQAAAAASGSPTASTTPVTAPARPAATAAPARTAPRT